MATGNLPTASGDLENSVKVPFPFPFRTVTLFVTWFTIAKSEMPSPLKSATAIAYGPSAVVGNANGEPFTCANVPSLLEMNTE